MLNIFPKQPCSGDIVVLKLEFFQADGVTPKDLTGLKIGVTVKVEADTSSDTGAIFKQDLPGDTTGIVVFHMGPFVFGTFWLDIKSWNGTERSSVIAPTQFKVQQSVTNRPMPV